MNKYKWSVALFLILVFIVSVSAESDSIILANDQTGFMMNDLLTFLSLGAVIFAAAIVIKIIMMMAENWGGG
jgi:hypothetical protein